MKADAASALDSSPAWDTFLSGPSGLRVLIVPSPEAVADVVVRRILDLRASTPGAHLGLATGSTFEPTFDRLAELEERGLADLEPLVLTHLDEYLGLGPESPGGMAAELEALLLGRLRRRPTFHPVLARNLPREELGARHEARLRELGPVHLQLLGIGRNGHLAFNEPGTPFGSRSHVARLAPATREALAPRFPIGPVPDEALTCGIATILEARELLLVATGGAKAEAVRAMLEGQVSGTCPASALRLHPRATVVLDRKAAAALGPASRRRPSDGPRGLLDPAALASLPGPVLVISPHPDDASISCGGLLASLGDSCRRIIATMTTGARALVPGAATPGEAAAVREAEVREEARILGAEALFLRSRYYESGAFEEEDAAALATLLGRIRPSIVLAPDRNDPHPTHRLTRRVADEALRSWTERGGPGAEVWTFEGPWHQLPPAEVTTLAIHSAAAEATKLKAVRAHRSQLARVPFDEGAIALARLRAVAFSESHLGGKVPGVLRELPPLEVYRREIISPA